MRLSLVRAANSPDPIQDAGHHVFRYAVHPGADIAAVVASGYEQNLALRRPAAEGTVEPWSVVRSDNEGVRIEAVKLADDRSGDVIVRVYEALGRRAATTLVPGFAVASVEEVDLLERPLGDDMARSRRLAHEGDAIALELRPFQVVTLRLTRG
ncbi:alpha-mannosidase [Microbacterium proteolyticum]|nr:alpha-mannosidase [Microbacterium proteolyticum]